MTTESFYKHNFNPNFDHKSPIIQMMKEKGFNNVKVDTCLKNGLSNYVTLEVDVLNENKCFANMDTSNGRAKITIRISNHESNLERHCGGVAGNKMTMFAFETLISWGAIKSSN
jgi:hypothetical protein